MSAKIESLVGEEQDRKRSFFTQVTASGTEREIFPSELLKPITSYSEMPLKVVETLRKAKDLGVNSFDCYRVSNLLLGEYRNDIDDEICYAKGFRINGIKFSQAKPGFSDTFLLVDNTPRQNYSDVYSLKVNESDPLRAMIAELRRERKINSEEHVAYALPKGSRSGVSPTELYEAVFPELARVLGLGEAVKNGEVLIRLPDPAEFIVFANSYYKDFGNRTSWEWIHCMLDGEIGSISDHFLIAGSSSYREGDDNVNFVSSRPVEKHSDSVVFRPVIEFNPKRNSSPLLK